MGEAGGPNPSGLGKHPAGGVYRGPFDRLRTREAVVHPNYILVYRVTADAVEIVSVVHARQEYP